MLYEALTGDVPFVGETPLATLRARLGQPLPHDPALGPLDAVLSEAAEPEPVLRLDAAELERRLASLEAVLPMPARSSSTSGLLRRDSGGGGRDHDRWLPATLGR